MKRSMGLASAILVACALGRDAGAQSSTTRVGVSGDRFSINGQPTFLLGASYYDPTGWRTSDLDGLAARGFNLIRCFLHWDGWNRSSFNSDGSLRNTAVLDLARACSARGIVVDVSILDSSVGSDQAGPMATAVRNAVRLLRNEPNVFFDLVNEHNGNWAPSHPHSVMGSLLAAARQEDPDAILTFSSAEYFGGHFLQVGSDTGVNSTNIQEELAQGVQILAPHFRRYDGWYAVTDTRVTAVRNYLASLGRSIPIYLQEESRRRGSNEGYEPTKENFLQAAREAKQAGAAGWVFHTDAGFDLGGSSWFGHLDSVERATVDALGAEVFGTPPPPPPPPAGTFTLTANPGTVTPGGTVTVSWTAPAGQTSALDWIGLHAGTAPPTSGTSLWWHYTNGATSGGFTVTAPATAGTYTFRYFLNDGFTSTASAPLTVSSAPPPPPPPSGQTPYGGTARAIPGTIEAEDFDAGGEGVAYHDMDASNNGGAYRTGEGVDLQPASEAGFNFGWAAPGEWLEYTVNVGVAGTYTIEVRVASSGRGGSFHVEFGGVDKSGPLSVPDTGGWQSWTTVTKAGASLSAGTQVMRIALDGAGPNGWVGNFNFVRIVAGGGGGGGSGSFALSATPSSVAPDGTITVAWTAPGGQTSPTDWIGLYAAGTSNQAYLDWGYTGGALTGSMAFTAPNTPGSYEFRYLLNNGYTEAARSNSVTVTAAGASFAVSASPSSAPPGGPVTASWTAPAGQTSTLDWIGLFPQGAANAVGQNAGWAYTNGATSGSLTFSAPATPGTYEFRYFQNDGFTEAARSNSVTVAAGGASFTVFASPSSISAGGPVTANWTAPTGQTSALDWIGLFPQGAANAVGQNAGWVYTNGATGGSVTFRAPGTPGTYEFRYFLNDGFTEAARSNPVSVVSAGSAAASWPAPLSASLTSAPPGSERDASGAPGSSDGSSDPGSAGGEGGGCGATGMETLLVLILLAMVRRTSGTSRTP